MPYSVRVTDEAFRPIKATVTYTDLDGVTTGRESIPVSASVFTLNDNLVNDSFSLIFSSPGYYDFEVSRHVLADVSDITLQAKPNQTLAVVGGVAILGIIAIFFKKGL